MDGQYRRSFLLRDVRVVNQKEDRHLQHKLNMLDKQHRYTCKMLQQRRDSLVNEQSRMVMVKICEPKATVNIAMREIGEYKNAEANFRGIHTSDGRGRSSPRNPQDDDKGSEQVEQSRTVSAPPASVKPTAPVRHRRNIRSVVSLMQMKNIAAIDLISEKELARQRQKAQEEAKRVRQLQTDMLHKRVTEFIQSLRDKVNVETLEEPL